MGGSDALRGVAVISTIFLSANALFLPGNARVISGKKNVQALHSVRECCSLWEVGSLLHFFREMVAVYSATGQRSRFFPGFPDTLILTYNQQI